MAKRVVTEEKIQVRSLLDSTLSHSGIKIKSRSIVMLDKEIAKFLVKKKYVEIMEVAEV